MKKNNLQNIDKAIGRLVSRFWAVLALLGAVGSFVFGLIVLFNGHFPGILLLLLGVLFLWLGVRTWRDRSTFGELLNRDFESAATSKKKADIGDSAHDPK